jgi:hypothetical protein
MRLKRINIGVTLQQCPFVCPSVRPSVTFMRCYRNETHKKMLNPSVRLFLQIGQGLISLPIMTQSSPTKLRG